MAGEFWYIMGGRGNVHLRISYWRLDPDLAAETDWVYLITTNFGNGKSTGLRGEGKGGAIVSRKPGGRQVMQIAYFGA